jgi:hypothetical protein
MKKLTLALSAIVAAFSASAKADVSVSGSTGAAYVSNMASSNNTDIIVGSAVAFAMSTTAANGMGISAGMGISLDPDASATAGAVTGGNAVTFTTGGATIVVGDVEAADTPGSVGGAVGGIVGDNNGSNTDVATGFADDDGAGISFSTSVGSATLSLVYISNDSADNHAIINSSTSGADSLTSASISVPMGAYTVTLGMADSDTGEDASGATVAAALGGGTLTVGYSNQTLVDGTSDTASSDLAASGDSTVMGATYAMSLDADTSVTIGYKQAKDADSDSTTQMDASISRSLGGGASVYLDIRNLSGDATTKGTAIGIGTSVSF